MPAGEEAEVRLNGAVPSKADLEQLFAALSNPALVTEKGGYLFKSRLEDGVFHFGVLPYFVNGERTYHYNIDLGPSIFTLIGSINANGSMAIFFKLDRKSIGRPLSDEEKSEFRRQYRALGAFLVARGMPRRFPLDMMTKQVVVEMGICPEGPGTLGDLADPADLADSLPSPSPEGP